MINKINIEQEDKALVTTKEKSLGTNFNQDNWILVIRLLPAPYCHNGSLDHLGHGPNLHIIFSVTDPKQDPMNIIVE